MQVAYDSGRCVTAHRRAAEFHRDLYPRPQEVDDQHESVDCEAAQVGATNAREIGGGYAGQRLRFADAQTLAIELANDFGGEDRFELLAVRVSKSRSRNTLPLPWIT